jgi:hypothetical protein
MNSDRIPEMRKLRPTAGVSLAELMIAMAVILIGMSGVAATLYFGFNSSDHGDKLAAATQHARTLIEIAVGQNFNDGTNIDGGTGLPSVNSGMNDAASQEPRELDAPPYYKAAFPPGRDLSIFKRKITIERRGLVGSPEQHLALMTVTIYWEEKGVERSVTTSAVIPHSALPSS